MDFDHRQVALVIARGRAGQRSRAARVPRHRRLAPVRFDRPPTRDARALLRLVGIRDLVLGVGAITTLKERTMDAEWVGMGAAADAVDGVVSLVTPGLLRRSRLVALVGGSAAAAGLLASRKLADERDAKSEIDS